MPRLLQAALRMLDRVLPARGVAPHIATGRRGEDEAYFYLRSQGYVVVARNFRSPALRGEVDLVGYDGDSLCFIEVKTRTTRDIKPAEAAVDAEKQHDLRRVARSYVRKLKSPAVPRFDIVSVYLDGPRPELTLFKNAFPMA